MRRNQGFTLLEVVVALAILGLALMAIFDLNAGAVNNHVYTKRLTVASLLARSKMTDVEQKLFDDGFNADDDEESGDFSDDGWPNFKWKARVIAPKLDGVTPDQLIGAIFNLPMGGDSSDPMSGIASLFSGGAGGGKDGASSNGPTQAGGGIGGAAMGMAQPMFTQMVQQLTQTVREVHLTVYWQEGSTVESIDLVTHVVSLGPGSDRNGGSTLNQAGGNTAGANNQWVDPDTGALVANPIPGPDNQMLHPQTRRPLMNRQEWLNRMNGGQQRSGGQGGLIPGGIQGGVRPPFQGLPGFQRRDR
ncbi:prepilin-type N-terminal cleavage/methylation domain-containing protein [Myxococcus sp. K15C18031901]|uniref:type IV pilus modification PilV family protein n=1 Tax=Myxococcus dinghuensis TaxID=2906761 RepID=UPI0020A70223|nr:prepilin-type N-terminal cleavage/methylation domain-containing protein [Myxococcus dinghuensis]MCP3097676.1 prepilin-type N-terminal cleavage/methylation domain-containing protein [Myxococcus dinghuensis]